ncbi:hypothetical protein PN4B1_16830 [Paenibacillus naphthalenovorans]|uniref:BC1872 family protein n=1 Tax=Paenibacillus naphthalenovorans TaxID=162209 RepID=UPI0010B596A7|nr:hypothetical protein [Paenibacillus naphthalenovorans]GCL71778.1 hypothetical protein PN4B1_16830 [Paenibacillus naphthalenovorans]
MDREMILKMEPGRELDALVAEKVMRGTAHTYVFNNKTINGMMFQIEDGVIISRVPHYSTDISSAWEVQEKLQDYGGMVLGCYGSKNGARWFSAQTVVNGKEISVTSHTAPEAICKAALLAVLDKE